MSFSRINYPSSFKMLRQDLLVKAIEIGNSLIYAGYKENMAEMIALSNAKLWPSTTNGSWPNKTNVHLVPHPDGWALISQDASSIYFTSDCPAIGLSRARLHAKNGKMNLYIHAVTGSIKDCESFNVNRPSFGKPKMEADGSKLKSKSESTRESSREGWLSKIKDNLFSNEEEGQIEGSLSV